MSRDSALKLLVIVLAMAVKDHLCLLLIMLVVCENVFSKSMDDYPFRNVSLPISERVKVLDQASFSCIARGHCGAKFLDNSTGSGKQTHSR